VGKKLSRQIQEESFSQKKQKNILSLKPISKTWPRFDISADVTTFQLQRYQKLSVPIKAAVNVTYNTWYWYWGRKKRWESKTQW